MGSGQTCLNTLTGINIKNRPAGPQSIRESQSKAKRPALDHCLTLTTARPQTGPADSPPDGRARGPLRLREGGPFGGTPGAVHALCITPAALVLVPDDEHHATRRERHTCTP